MNFFRSSFELNLTSKGFINPLMMICMVRNVRNITVYLGILDNTFKNFAVVEKTRRINQFKTLYTTLEQIFSSFTFDEHLTCKKLKFTLRLIFQLSIGTLSPSTHFKLKGSYFIFFPLFSPSSC